MKKTSTKEYVAKWYKKILHIYNFTYGANFYYFSCKTHDEYKRAMKKNFDLELESKDSEGSFNLIHNDKSGMDIGCIWVKPKNYANLAHECLHATFWVMDRVGIEYNRKSEEAFSYMQSFLIKTILKNWSSH